MKDADEAVEILANVRAEIGKVVFGQERVVELTLAAILAGGHALLIGAPGLAKTKLVETTARGARARLGPRAVHAGPDAVRHPRLGDPG